MYTGMIIRSEFDHREKETKGNHEMSYVDLKSKTILVTGAAGFIGSNLVKRLYEDVEDVTVIGIDNMNDYYDVRLKEARLLKAVLRIKSWLTRYSNSTDHRLL